MEALAALHRGVPVSLAEAEFHRLVPALLRARSALDADERAAASAVVQQAMRLSAAVAGLQPVLDEAAGRWALVKGIALAARYHGAFDARQTSDLDVLVPRARLVEVVAAMKQQGVAAAPGWRRALGSGAGEVPLRVTEHVTLDLHWSLLHSSEARTAFDLPTDELLAESQPVEIMPGLVVPTTSTSDTLLHLAYHTATSGPERLGPLDDLRRVALAVDDWDELVGLAERRRMALLLGCMLERVESTFGAGSVPTLTPRQRAALGEGTVWQRIHHAVDEARPASSAFGRSGHARLVIGSTRASTATSATTLARHTVADVRARARGRVTLADTRFSDALRPRVLMLSLEPWDDTWRRNQHLARALLADRLVESVVVVEPPVRRGSVVVREPWDGVTAVRPVQPLPDKAGGKQWLGRWVRETLLGEAEVLWVNDAPLGRWVLHDGIPTLHDVTDDWRQIPQPWDARRRLVAAEDVLARRARTVVCSEVLAQRWRERYGVDPDLVPNAVDLSRYGFGAPVPLAGPGPHLLYAGTLHEDRLDLDLLVRLAAEPAVGTVHLLGPDLLPPPQRQRLVQAGVVLHPPVPGPQVSLWLQSADLLVLPHRVDAFTLSLDAIKAYEYQAAHRPVVATPTSGFQHLRGSGMAIAEPADLVATAARVVRGEQQATALDDPPDWKVRAAAMGVVLRGLVERGYPPVTDA